MTPLYDTWETVVSLNEIPEFKFPNLQELHQECLDLPWLTERSARREFFMSDKPRTYSYGNRHSGDQEYSSSDFSPKIAELIAAMNHYHDGFNVCFLNRYENEQQHLGWHADDFPGMDEAAPIAVLSLGAEREIWWKPKGDKGVVPKDHRQLLQHGSFWTMPPGMQDTHLHRIPKHSQPCGIRISLTFRKFLD